MSSIFKRPFSLPGIFHKLASLLRAELRHLTKVQASDRAWQMPIAAALASGLPLLIGAWFDHLSYGLVSSMGGMAFLYLPGTPMSHRMVSVMACAFGISACYALGIMSHVFPALMMPVLAFLTILATMVVRFYHLGPPGSLFFIMAASIGAYSPTPLPALATMVGLLTLGCLLACLIAFFYSVYMLRRHAPKPVPTLHAPTFDYVVFDSVVIGVFVGISMALAQLLHLERAYWVPISCLAVIQGVSLRAIWTRQLHRVLGTSVGLLLAWGVLLLPLDRWSIAIIMMSLSFIIESLVVRHYAIAVVFITPLTILLAEAATLGHVAPASLVTARFFDTLLGCLVGLIGGVCLHNKRFRDALGRPLRRLIPARLLARPSSSRNYN